MFKLAHAVQRFCLDNDCLNVFRFLKCNFQSTRWNWYSIFSPWPIQSLHIWELPDNFLQSGNSWPSLPEYEDLLDPRNELKTLYLCLFTFRTLVPSEKYLMAESRLFFLLKCVACFSYNKLLTRPLFISSWSSFLLMPLKALESSLLSRDTAILRLGSTYVCWSSVFNFFWSFFFWLNFLLTSLQIKE